MASTDYTKKMSGKEKISEQLSAYLDGELTEGESRRVAEMVAGDPALSAELEALRSVQSLVRNLPTAQAPADMTDAVLTKAQRRGDGWWLGYLARAAVVLLAVGVGITVTTWLNRPTHSRQTKPQTPSVLKTPVLAKGKIGGLASPETAETTNVFINTDNLLLTQREVEHVFGKNSIKPMVETESPAKVAVRPRGRANFYNQTQVAPTRIRYEVVIEENQMRQIVSELNEIRARQNVSQMPMRRIKDNNAIALAKADYRSESTAGRADRDTSYRKSMRDKRRSGEDSTLKHIASEVEAVKDAASQPAATPRPGLLARDRLAEPTTMPASTFVAQRMRQKAGDTMDQKVVHQQAATLATANVRQLVVILNGVGGE